MNSLLPAINILFIWYSILPRSNCTLRLFSLGEELPEKYFIKKYVFKTLLQFLPKAIVHFLIHTYIFLFPSNREAKKSRNFSGDEEYKEVLQDMYQYVE